MADPRVALVTGSGKRRVGRFVADALAQRGYALALHYRSSAADAAAAVADYSAQGIAAAAFGADLANESAVQRMVREVLAKFGRIDVLVNAAAIWNRKRLEDVTAADVREHFDANVLGTFLVSRAVGLTMTAQAEGGCIITIGDWADTRPYRDYAAYFASKGGIPTLTRCLAVELGTRNPRVRVNCIQPGPVMLPLDLPEAERREAIEATLVKREGSPENVAQAALALIENDFITGVSLPVDGGRTVFAG